VHKNLYLRLSALGILILGGLGQSAQAADFIYTLTGTGGVGVGPGNVAFSGATFTFSGIGNTASTTTISGSYPAVTLTSLTVNISGVTTGDATVSSTMYLADLTSFIGPGTFGFVNNALMEGIVFSSPALVGWNKTSAIGPTPILHSGGAPTPTNQGTVKLTGWTSATFTAAPYSGGGGSLVPEAPGAAMLLPGLLPLAAMALKRRSKR